MKMVKSLLLGSAAGLVAVAGAQAADLPVKAKAVEYVKVCSLYGAGYYYMPGSDICLKLGGFVRYQASTNPGQSLTTGPLQGLAGAHTRISGSDFGQRVRAVATVDTRTQTQYGTLRTYLLIGYNQDTVGTAGAPTTSPPVYMNRGFIQVAGFTLGKATSFFDIYPNASFGYFVGTMHVPDTGDAGQIVATYTMQFGNGVSASIGIEHSRKAAVVFNGTAGSFLLGATPTTNALSSAATFAVSGLPDVVGNLRIDQAWGSILAAFALHDTSGGYYGATENLGHPANKWGWAATIGAIFNLPMIAAGDRFSFQFVYSEGAIRYASLTPGGGTFLGFNGSTVAFGLPFDGIYGAGGAVQLTTAWSVMGGFEHLWNPALRTSIFGSYLNVTHNAAAIALVCATAPNATATTAGNFTWGAGCNPNFNTYAIGSRTQWEPVRGWIMGLEVLYLNLHSARTAAGTVVMTGALAGKSAATYTIADQSAWVFTFRTQRDYHP